MLSFVDIVVIFSAGLLCQAAAQDIYFSRNPVNADVVAGESVTLECEVSDPAGIVYSWQLKSAALTNTTRRHQRGSDLHVTRADRVRDAGDFLCIATNVVTGFSIASMTATLNILWLGEPVHVQLQTPDSPDRIKAGDNVTLRCQVDGSGDIRVDWFRNAERVTKSDRISLSKKRLHIKGATVADNGVYRCSAHNDAGARSSSGNFALAIPGKSSAVIQHSPQDLLVKEGSSARFDCVYKQADLIEWYFKINTPLENTTSTMVYPNGSLLIREVRPEDEGMYSCVGIREDSDAVPETYSAKLNIAFLEDFSPSSFEPAISADHTLIAPEKAEFELTCLIPRGAPPPRAWWLDPRGHVVSDAGPVRVDDTRLIVEAARPVEDSGDYTCVVENTAGSRRAEFKLIVSTPPSIVSSPVSLVAKEGDPAELVCVFSAMPHPVTNVRWLKDGRHVAEDGRQRVRTHRHNGTLAIAAVQLTDRGEYACQVNTTGFPPVNSKAATLQVKERLRFSPRPVNKNLELGSTVKVYCRAQGSTPPVVKWIKEGKAGQHMFQFPEHVQDLNGTLHFNNVRIEDKGRYMCVATNSEGLINATINIDVVVTPKFSVFPQNALEAYEDYPITIHCIAEGDPKPTIKWDRNGNVSALDPARFHVLSNGSLVVHRASVDDSDRYGCTAGNSGGFKRAEVMLIVRQADEFLRPLDGGDADGHMMTKTVIITLSAAAAYMVLVVGLMIWCRYRRRRRKQAYLDANGGEGGVCVAEGGDRTELQEAANRGRGDRPRSDGGDTAQSHSSGQSKRSKTSYERLAFPRQDLHSLVLLGHGEFGEIFLAKAKRDSEDSVVLVKSLQQTREESALLEFQRELDMFHKLDHENVVKLVGVCREQEPHYLILQYTDWGDLKQFLLATRGLKTPHPPKLSLPHIMQLCLQVAIGMEHLANHRFVHRDLAARNCLIASNMSLKIALCAPSKDTYNKEYYKHHNQVIPLRWLPHESVYEDDYSTKSDVYSFACLVWEIFHQAEMPFSKLSDDAVLAALKTDGLHWKCHKTSPASLQTLLNSCWSHSPRDRPTFTQVAVSVGEISIDSSI